MQCLRFFRHLNDPQRRSLSRSKLCLAQRRDASVMSAWMQSWLEGLATPDWSVVKTKRPQSASGAQLNSFNQMRTMMSMYRRHVQLPVGLDIMQTHAVQTRARCWRVPCGAVVFCGLSIFPSTSVHTICLSAIVQCSPFTLEYADK